MDKSCLPELLEKLSKSKFRNSFKLDDKDFQYIKRVGFSKIGSHARDFVTERLAPVNPKNDGKQTPFHGHPVFKAQHATATCCRKCLNRWHKIPRNRRLSLDQVSFITDLIREWIKNAYYRKMEE